MKHIQTAYETCCKLLPGIFTLSLALSCIPLFRGIQSMRDISAPELIEVMQPDEHTLTLTFDQEIQGEADNFIPHEGFSLDDMSIEANVLHMHISKADDPGKEYIIEGVVQDLSSNELWFFIPFYGFNGNSAELVISEFINENSSSRYEKVEFYVKKGGNLGGITVYNGAATEYKSNIVLASQEVNEGDFLIVHFRSQEGSSEETGEIDEYGPPSDDVLNEAFSPQAIAGTRDFWATGGQGLSDTNGAVSVYYTPAGNAPFMDAAVYSNRSYDPDDKYGSFGTAYTWTVMQEIFAAGGWVSEYDMIRPEDCIRTEPSTSTRSINRDQLFSDTDSPEDWHIVPTGQSSFGAVNSMEVHEQ
ncbi:MAG: hypothetical protein ACR2PY_00615 [Salinispira sp.]